MRTLLVSKVFSAALLLVVVAALAAVVANTDPQSARAEGTPAPLWLEADANRMIASFSGSAAGPSSAAWVNATWGDYVEALGSNGDRESNAPAYIVVARGDFVSIAPSPEVGGHSTEGRILVLGYDAITKELSNIDLLYGDDSWSEAALGELTSLRLP